ncbi:MAG: hypothetical protein P8N31_05805 [Planctomycetota bacterium]|nr:hypothetical protein [Planctomycetota bacterium]MDG2143049.1 hypothetical protein [Planctomycetota bacterium]
MGTTTNDYVLPSQAAVAPRNVAEGTGGKPSAGLVFWLPPEEAALRFGVTVEELVTATKRGHLSVQAKVAGGKLVATICSTELIARYGEPRRGKLDQPLGKTHDAELAQLRDELQQQGRQLGEVQLENAHMQGELEAADRVERSLQRYADRVEQRLEDVSVTYEARLAEGDRLRLSMARTMGRMESELLKLQEQVASTEAATLAVGEGAGKKKLRRRWFFGR